MPVSGSEIASLDFANLIGGPLNAVIDAQAKSALSTAKFIREVGFDSDGKVKNVDFKYNKKNQDGVDQEFTMTVPFLTMLPIPYITVDSAVIEFNAKITSVTEKEDESINTTTASANVGGNYWFVRASLKASTAQQKKSKSTDVETRAFDMHVRVVAHNEDMPAGTERLLGILEECIREKAGEVKDLSIPTVKSVDPTNGKKLTYQGPAPANINLLKGGSIVIDNISYVVTTLTGNDLELDKPAPQTTVGKLITVRPSAPSGPGGAVATLPTVTAHAAGSTTVSYTGSLNKVPSAGSSTLRVGTTDYGVITAHTNTTITLLTAPTVQIPNGPFTII